MLPLLNLLCASTAGTLAICLHCTLRSSKDNVVVTVFYTSIWAPYFNLQEIYIFLLSKLLAFARQPLIGGGVLA
ncbi:hypothetical protein F4777DRAFT_411656 [Nemania sp. FL0916]|nr:hypothetical protein F4777DRAFT_411656 [Nemania sp. FL0916]